MNLPVNQSSPVKPVVFLMGATACGKTELSLRLAEQLNAEIISVDSALVYRGLDIGTAKPSLAERESIAHHLIDVCDPWDNFSAARFCNEARRSINDIQARGKLAMLVGGTMLYFKALAEGLADLPEANSEIRDQIVSEAKALGWPAMHAKLASVDPASANRIHPNDPQRLQRALEVFLLAGKPMSELIKNTRPLLACQPYKFALVPQDRSWLHKRIALRFAHMVRAGFLDEVRRLRNDPRIHAELSSMRSVGYRQAWNYLDQMSVDGHSTEWISKAEAATRQLAKRQLTWIRGMDGVKAIHTDQLSIQDQERCIIKVLDVIEN